MSVFSHLPEILRIAILPLLFLALPAFGEEPGDICDVGRAKEYCDAALLEDIEGIWHYTEDDVKVLIRRRPLGEGVFDMIVLETPDCRLKPGERIGEVEATTYPDKYRMEIFTSRKGDILTDSSKCLATLSKDKDAMAIEPRKLKFRLRHLSILPKFWRMVGMSVSDPAGEVPRGVVKIYPAFDGNGLSRRQLRYL